MKFKLKLKEKIDSYRNHRKFLWIPKFFKETNSYHWLEFVYIRQLYTFIFDKPQWVDVCLINKEGTPIHLIELEKEYESEYGKNSTLEEEKLKYTKLGINSDKLVLTKIPSIGYWDISKNYFSNLMSSPNDIRYFSLQTRYEISPDEVLKINNSKGIIVTNCLYGSPYYRYDYIPT